MNAIAILGGGCFWCLEAAFQQLAGVHKVVSGYCGGHINAPSYAQVCRGDTGHAEVVEVHFDPAKLPYATLLQAFFAVHDPTTHNRQGNDVGSQYRSVIFTTNEEQGLAARTMIANLEKDKVFLKPIVTQVLASEKFWPAEISHQDYFARNPQQPYCQAVVAPKVAKLRAVFGDHLRDQPISTE